MSTLIGDTITLRQLGSDPFSVQAYRIVVSATPDVPLRLPGGSVELLAKEIIFEPGAQIDVSGVPGLTKGIADPVIGIGKDGISGVIGNSGQDAGRIRIVCDTLLSPVTLLARGGEGGNGQNGSNGTKGAQGDPGTIAAFQWQTRKGGKGKPGGAGSEGGQGGPGGKGGFISVEMSHIDPNDLVAFIIDVGGGKAGLHGNYGLPGTGGDPGSDGHYCGRYVPPQYLNIALCPISAGNDGQGDYGPLPIELWPLSPGVAGDPGGHSFEIKPPDVISKLVGVACDDAYVQTILTSSETLYYNNQPMDAGKYLEWLYRFTL